MLSLWKRLGRFGIVQRRDKMRSMRTGTRTIKDLEGLVIEETWGDRDEINFSTSCGRRFVMHHHQD